MVKTKIIVIILTFSIIFMYSISHAQQIGIWTATDEVANIPTDNCAWDQVKKGADSVIPDSATVSDQNSNNNAQILASAIVYIRTNIPAYRDKVVYAIEKLISKGKPSLHLP